MITLQHVDRIPASVARINRLYAEQQREKAEKQERLTRLALKCVGVVLGIVVLAVIF